MHSLRTPALVAAGSLCVLLASPARAQSPFATQVARFLPGPGGGAAPDLALGGPQGGGLSAGSLHALSLGDGGSLTLGFDVAIVDGPGADLTVFENGFVVGGGPSVFAEILHVEVSSDGIAFARFPSRYAGSGTAMGAFRGLGGGMPVIADVTTGAVDPLDPTVSGGEALDLADLASDPAVTSGAVDLGAIRFVRLIDVQSGDTDSSGVPLPASGAADVDAVAVLNGDAWRDPGQPVCDLFFDASERLHLVLGDPDGLATLDLASLSASWNLSPLPLAPLVGAFQVQSASATEVHLVTAPLAGLGFQAALAVSVRDVGGRSSSDQAMVQG